MSKGFSLCNLRGLCVSAICFATKKGFTAETQRSLRGRRDLSDRLPKATCASLLQGSKFATVIYEFNH